MPFARGVCPLPPYTCRKNNFTKLLVCSTPIPLRPNAGMIRINVVSAGTIGRILSRHDAFRNTCVAETVAFSIHEFAYHGRFLDVVQYLMCAFDAWRRGTSFHPKPSHAPTYAGLGHAPAMEHTRFAGRNFYRPRHSAGVTFATFVPLKGIDTGVVWTTKRKALLYQFHQGTWTVVKVLHRQDAPFRTWMRFLGGSQMTHELSKELAHYGGLSAREAFRIIVVPFFEEDVARKQFPLAAAWNDHPVWDIVRDASLRTVDETDPVRYEWKRVN